MKALAVLFFAVATLFSTAAKADGLTGGYGFHVESKPLLDNVHHTYEGMVFQTTLYRVGRPDQIVWKGAGIVQSVTPSRLVVDGVFIGPSGHTLHNLVVFRWDVRTGTYVLI